MSTNTSKQLYIALVGLSGSGKSTVGQLLAAERRSRFIDTDREIERGAGMTIDAIFASQGEVRFRELEAAQIERAFAGDPAVVSLGGGAILSARNREIILSRSTVIWLHSDPKVLAARLAAQAGAEERPLLQGGDPAAKLDQLLSQRRVYYSQAHVHVDTNSKTPEEVTHEILRALDSQPQYEL